MRIGYALTLALFVVATASAAPPNDECQNATAVTGFPFGEDTDTTSATQAAGDPVMCFSGGGPTVWYRVVPTFTGQMCVATCGGTSYDTIVGAFAGTCGAPGASLRCNDSWCRFYGSRITIDVAAGVERLVEIARYYAVGTSTPGGPLHVKIAQVGADADGDGVDDCADDCATVANPTQADRDYDEIGDACDACPLDSYAADVDGDGFCPTCGGACDNCPYASNPGQEDGDGDGTGDPCDNCPGLANPDQADREYDGRGDACDPCPGDFGTFDYDRDGFCGDASVCPAGCDNCSFFADPAQLDTDGDGYGDVCDDCPLVFNPDQRDVDGDGLGDACDPCPADQVRYDSDGDGRCSDPALCPAGCDDCPYAPDPAQLDGDGDGIGDACDDCPAVSDSGQGDSDGDGIGNACDACPIDWSPYDYDGDGYCSDPALCPAGCDTCPGVPNADNRDADGDGYGDACDNCPYLASAEFADWDGDGLGNVCDPCTACGGDTCAARCWDFATNTCAVADPVPDGTTCSDANLCTDHDRCQSGVCTGDAVVCAAGGSCQEATTCLPFSGCVYAPAANGVPCDDGDRCTTGDACVFGACAGTPQEACPVDQYKCYRAASDRPLAEPLDYTDALGTQRVLREPASQVCNPTTDGVPIEDPHRHLTCWRTRADGTTPGDRATVALRDRFGTSTLRLGRPTAYCAPSEEPGVPASAALDEYACYRARGPRRAATALTLGDQFETRGTTVLKPYSVCYPASRGGAGLVDAAAHFTCYALKESSAPAMDTHTITLTSPLGGEALRTRSKRLLCVPSTTAPCATVQYTTVAGSPDCGGTNFQPPASAPFGGAIFDAAVGGKALWALGLGCRYFGGGQSVQYPAFQQATGSATTFEADTCDGDTLALHATGGSTSGDCPLGPLAQKTCMNAAGRACATDADCGGQGGSCIATPRCFGGAPVPIQAGIASACILSALTDDLRATVDVTTGALALTTSSRTLVYVTGFGNIPNPCPLCVSGACTTGMRTGLACTPTDPVTQTSLDCLPDLGQFYLSIGPGTSTLGNAPLSLAADASGNFCPGQVHPGAFGESRSRRIELAGGLAGDLRDHAPHPTALLDLSCVQTVGSPIGDQLADFPGPLAGTTAGVIQLLP